MLKSASYVTLALAGLIAIGHTATAQTAPADATTTPSEELTDNDWRTMSREERRERGRRRALRNYEPDGRQPSLDRLDHYLAVFAKSTVYDPRYYRFDVKATHVEGTTGTVRLTGDAYHAHYKRGIEDALRGLGFNVENQITALPTPEIVATTPYAVSTTIAATVRSEPRRNAEQLNSVGLGGVLRVLRPASESDVSSSAGAMGRRAPGADRLAPDTWQDWMLVQTMDGYLGFARKADLKFTKEYRLPDGVVKAPVRLDNGTTVPAGAFVYARGDNGWKLHSGEALPDSISVTSLRASFTAEDIEKLLEPFMQTEYVWGGVTDAGIDCSGFSQFFTRAHGVMIPRDAVQQANTGLIVAWGRDVQTQAQPGDLIFYANDNGRIGHVSISLGNGRIIHSIGRGVQFGDLSEDVSEDEVDNYDGRVLFARRVLAR